MYEKVNPTHPDKVADRIAGALVDSKAEIRCQQTIFMKGAGVEK